MALNAPIFLFLFLPIFLLLYVLVKRNARNAVLLLFSLLFFAWSDPFYLPLILLLCLVNYLVLGAIGRRPPEDPVRGHAFIFGVTINVLLLLGYKLLVAYGGTWMSVILERGIRLPAWLVFLLTYSIQLPLGISFLAFQAISMLADEYRSGGVQKAGMGEVFNYLLMFPKMIAGPLTRFRDTLGEIRQREWDWNRVVDGARQFIVGFAKKVLIADQLALITNEGIFDVPPARIPFGIAWLMVISFALQIYYDFSGYTDMAIGLGRMLGFRFPENFNYPYISTSITDFWRRWHITLSNWFREYVFYPLERKRRELPVLNQSLNILIVFLLTGLWHGITPSFILWGLLHGLALVVERGRFGIWLSRSWKPLQHLYALGVILIGWIFFRSPTLAYAWDLLKVLLRIMPSNRMIPYSVFPPVATITWAAFIAGLVFSVPLPASLQIFRDEKPANRCIWVRWLRNLILIMMLAVGIIIQAGALYHPFIYGEF
jgi:alginate O-acetyltransferase complex protein AlgI